MDYAQDTRTETETNESHTESQQPQDLAQNEEILIQRRQQLAKDPRNVMLLNEVGLAAERVGDIDRALWAFKRAIRLDPDYAQAHRNLGLLYRKEGRGDQAVEVLRQYARLTGDDAEVAIPQEAAGQASEMREAGTARSLEESPIFSRLRQVWDEAGLTPAEAMMLLDLDNSNGLQMMEYTLLDLVARHVFEADGRLRVGRGEAYDQTNLAPHEALFAKYFSRINDYVDINQLARAALVELDDDGDSYKSVYVRGALLQKGYLELETRRIAGILPIQHTVLSHKGVRTRNRLERLVSEADRQMARSLVENPEQANAYVDQGGPGLLLAQNYPSKHFKRWHDMLTRIGFGPSIEQLRSRARKSELGAYLDDILRTLLGD